jgi:hypothetical protein
MLELLRAGATSMSGRRPSGPQVFTPADAAFETLVRDSFARQRPRAP